MACSCWLYNDTYFQGCGWVQVLRSASCVLILRRIFRKWSICGYIYNYKSCNEITVDLFVFIITACNILKHTDCTLETTFNRKHPKVKSPENFSGTYFYTLGVSSKVLTSLLRQVLHRFLSNTFQKSTQTVLQTKAIPKLWSSRSPYIISETKAWKICNLFCNKNHLLLALPPFFLKEVAVGTQYCLLYMIWMEIIS